jgi:arginase
MKSIKLIKNRSDIGAGTRGADMGIDALEVAAINENNAYFTQFPHIDVESENETIYNKVNAIFAKRITSVKEQCQRVANAVKEALNNEFFPIVISGDHSSALGTISGIKASYPEKRLGVVWIDAHADLHSPFTSPSGNVHGMPLAAALDVDNIENRINGVTDYTQNEWDALKSIGIEGAKIEARDLIFFGVRDTESPEEKLMESLGIRNYMVHEMRYRGFETCLQEAVDQLSDCDMVYISFDVDSMDCDYVSYGTGTPVAKGFHPDEVEYIINALIESGKVICLEIAEINPLLDRKGNRMAEAAFYVLNSVTTTLMSLNKS